MKSAAIHTLARKLADCCNSLHAAGLSPGRSGNISLRDDELIWITPSGYSLAEIRPEHLVQIWPDGRMVANPGLEASSELAMHLKIYETRSDVGAVVHTHPPRGTALAVAHQPLDMTLISEITSTLGQVPVLDFRIPGTLELAEHVASGMKTRNAALLANHGVITVGPTIDDAYYSMELVESFAEIYLHARQLNGLNVLTDEQLGH